MAEFADGVDQENSCHRGRRTGARGQLRAALVGEAAAVEEGSNFGEALGMARDEN